MTTYEEWRVTGVLADRGEGEPYTHTWRPPAYADPEREARSFLAESRELIFWKSGPHLHRRTVNVSEWESA